MIIIMANNLNIALIEHFVRDINTFNPQNNSIMQVMFFPHFTD